MDQSHWQGFDWRRGRPAAWRVSVLFALASCGSAQAQSPYRLTLFNPGDGLVNLPDQVLDITTAVPQPST